MSNWTIEEVGNIDLGDQRLNKKVVKILGSASNSSEGSIPRACKTWGETLATYRFFNNKKVSNDKILNGHINNSIERIKKERIVLIPQDTTEIRQ